MPKSTYLDNTVLNTFLRGMPVVAPPTVYLALYTTSPTAGGGGVEVTGGGYIRQIAVFGAPAAQTVLNTVDVTFPIATAPYGTIVGYALFDAVSGGNMLYFADLSAPRAIQVNDQVRFPVGQLIATET
jgi:hypothetical protein